MKGLTKIVKILMKTGMMPLIQDTWTLRSVAIPTEDSSASLFRKAFTRRSRDGFTLAAGAELCAETGADVFAIEQKISDYASMVSAEHFV